MSYEERADLHVHYKKGYEARILTWSSRTNTRVLGVIEHATVNTKALGSFVEMGRSKGFTILPGVEMLFVHQNGAEIPYEIVGLGFDLKAPEIFRLLDPRGDVYSSVHQEKVAFQRGYLADLGFDTSVTEENRAVIEPIEKLEVAATAYPLCKAATLNPKNRLLIEKLAFEQADQIAEMAKTRPEDATDFPKFLYWQHFAKGQPGYRIWGNRVEVTDVSDTIHNAGGVVLLAHPEFQHIEDQLPPETILSKLLDLGFDGLEGWNARPLNRNFAQIAWGRNLLVGGGSGKNIDYDNRIIGLGDKEFKDMFIPSSVLGEIRAYQIKHNLISKLRRSSR